MKKHYDHKAPLLIRLSPIALLVFLAFKCGQKHPKTQYYNTHDNYPVLDWIAIPNGNGPWGKPENTLYLYPGEIDVEAVLKQMNLGYDYYTPYSY